MRDCGKADEAAVGAGVRRPALANRRILVVSPVRNEAAHIERVVRAMAAQELAPERWIVIDDSSTDGTLEILRSLAPEIPFMDVLEAPLHPPDAVVRDRLARAFDARNFNAGLAADDWTAYTHIMKLDGDIELPPPYLRVLMDRFAANPRLGLAGGVLAEPTPEGTLRPLVIPRHHVHGAVKCYTHACFAAIGGMQERLGWDTIDETYARMRGFATVSFEDLVSTHHRPWGTADGALRGRARLGECAYITQYPPSWAILRTVKLLSTRPRGMVGLAYLFGYCRAAVRRTERVRDRAYRRFTHRELRRRMVGFALRPVGRGRAAAATALPA
jgi:poly-beta-1,6-N-acetyl-D-glucosamine synthase